MMPCLDNSCIKYETQIHCRQNADAGSAEINDSGVLEVMKINAAVKIKLLYSVHIRTNTRVFEYICACKERASFC